MYEKTVWYFLYYLIWDIRIWFHHSLSNVGIHIRFFNHSTKINIVYSLTPYKSIHLIFCWYHDKSWEKKNIQIGTHALRRMSICMCIIIPQFIFILWHKINSYSYIYLTHQSTAHVTKNICLLISVRATCLIQTYNWIRRCINSYKLLDPWIASTSVKQLNLVSIEYFILF